MRQKEKGRHWKDNRTLGNRAFFSFKETGMKSETGAMQIASFLTIEDLRPEDNGFYRCRVDFKEAPTKNTKINLKLIGKCACIFYGSTIMWCPRELCVGICMFGGQFVGLENGLQLMLLALSLNLLGALKQCFCL